MEFMKLKVMSSVDEGLGESERPAHDEIDTMCEGLCCRSNTSRNFNVI
jgi:hypothetical protein